jgi:uncharacterized membrane protein YdjX (TVP38/TMEM64 family)
MSESQTPSPDPAPTTAPENAAAPLTKDYADQWAEASSAPSSVKPLLKGLVLIASLVVIGAAFKALGLADALDTHWLDEQVVGKGLWGEALFIVLGAVLTAVGVPRQLVAVGGGYAFGLLWGTMIALVAQTLGCALTFFYARLLGRSLIQNRFGQRIQRIDAFLRTHTFSMALLIRFLPVGSNVLTNLAVGVSSVRALPFLAGSAVGYIPQTVIFVVLGSGIHLDSMMHTVISVAMFVVSGLISVALYRRVRKRVP